MRVGDMVKHDGGVWQVSSVTEGNAGPIAGIIRDGHQRFVYVAHLERENEKPQPSEPWWNEPAVRGMAADGARVVGTTGRTYGKSSSDVLDAPQWLPMSVVMRSGGMVVSAAEMARATTTPHPATSDLRSRLARVFGLAPDAPDDVLVATAAKAWGDERVKERDRRIKGLQDEVNQIAESRARFEDAYANMSAAYNKAIEGRDRAYAEAYRAARRRESKS